MALLNRKQITSIILAPRNTIIGCNGWEKWDDGGFYWEYTKEKNDETYGIYIWWYGEGHPKNLIKIHEKDLYFDTPYTNFYGAADDLLGANLPNGQTFHFA